MIGPGSVPKDLGRTQRVVSPARRRALDARDGSCVFAGCEAPNRWCEAHHVLEWMFDGPTDLDDLGLLCERHHTKVHSGVRVERQPDGRWRTYRPDGSEIIVASLRVACLQGSRGARVGSTVGPSRPRAGRAAGDVPVSGPFRDTPVTTDQQDVSASTKASALLSATSADGRSRVWRPPLVLQTLFVSSGVALCIGAFLPWDGDSTGEGAALFRPLLFVGGLAWFLPAYRSRMELRDDRLILRYAFTSRVVSLDTLVAVTAGREGLWFETVDGARFGSPGLIGEKSPLATWLGRRTRADDMVDAILAARPGP